MNLRRLILAAATIGGGIVSAVMLRGFVSGARGGDTEYYLAVGALVAAVAATAALYKLSR